MIHPVGESKEQEWQKLRREVAEMQSDSTDYDHRDISKRVRLVEVRLTALEERGFAKFEALANAYGTMATAQERLADTMDEMVSRKEFDSIKYLMYAVVVAVFFIMVRK